MCNPTPLIFHAWIVFSFTFLPRDTGKFYPVNFTEIKFAVHYGAILTNGMLKYCLKSELFPDESTILYIDNLEQDYDKFLPISWRDDLAR